MKESGTALKFEDEGKVEQIVWEMRLADQPRATNRNILNRTFNGEPPFDANTAEENNVEVNRNFLEGTGNLTDARTQWNSNFLKPGDIFTVRLDSGPAHKRTTWSMSITKNLMRALKRHLGMISQARETGAGVLLHGVGPSAWSDRRSPIPKVIPLASLMIPSETDIDFDNLEYFAVFREMTPAQLYEKTHGPKVDPGWNMDLVETELKFVGEQTQKQPNATAFQFMPERIEELVKQDLGYWGSDAVPTIDYWDFYFRQEENGSGWYRRIFLDWSSSGREVSLENATPGNSPNNNHWLYSSGQRQYAKTWQEIVHCNYGDCSCVAPFKYHSVRSLGWMIWGIVDIQNRLRCKITEQAFSDLMWFFRVASQNDFNRLKKANFMQMGVIPTGIDWVKAQERFTPNPAFIELVIAENRQLMNQHSASFTRNSERVDVHKEKTATQVLAETNSINTMVSGVMNMAYTYEAFKYREICRRFCLPNNPDPMVRKFRKACLDEGVPPEYLDVERWEIEPERAVGAGNRTVQMAIVQYLNGIRMNLGPEAQRKVDHLGIQIMTEDATVAEDLAPVQNLKAVSHSTHDAELSTDRILRGLKFTPTPQMVYGDYVMVWLRDMAAIIKRIKSTGNVGTLEQVLGLQNLANHTAAFLQILGRSKQEAPKVRMLSDALGKMMNEVKGFAQRLAQQGQAGNGQGADPEAAAKLKGKLLIDTAKAENLRESHAQKTAQKQVSFELQQQQQEEKHRAELRREAEKANVEMHKDAAQTRLDMHHQAQQGRLDMNQQVQQAQLDMATQAAAAAQAATEPTEE